MLPYLKCKWITFLFIFWCSRKFIPAIIFAIQTFTTVERYLTRVRFQNLSSEMKLPKVYNFFRADTMVWQVCNVFILQIIENIFYIFQQAQKSQCKYLNDNLRRLASPTGFLRKFHFRHLNKKPLKSISFICKGTNLTSALRKEKLLTSCINFWRCWDLAIVGF